MALSCVIVDDNADFLDAAREVLEAQELTVSGVASTGAEALSCIGELRPDVVLVDVDLGPESGFEVARRITDVAGVPVVLISTYEESDFEELVAESPAVGFVSKSDLTRSAIDELLEPR